MHRLFGTFEYYIGNIYFFVSVCLSREIKMKKSILVGTLSVVFIATFVRASDPSDSIPGVVDLSKYIH